MNLIPVFGFVNAGAGGVFFAGFLMLAYFCFIVGILIFLLVLLTRFIRAHERVADALEAMTRQRPGGVETKR